MPVSAGTTRPIAPASSERPMSAPSPAARPHPACSDRARRRCVLFITPPSQTPPPAAARSRAPRSGVVRHRLSPSRFVPGMRMGSGMAFSSSRRRGRHRGYRQRQQLAIPNILVPRRTVWQHEIGPGDDRRSAPLQRPAARRASAPVPAHYPSTRRSSAKSSRTTPASGRDRRHAEPRLYVLPAQLSPEIAAQHRSIGGQQVTS